MYLGHDEQVEFQEEEHILLFKFNKRMDTVHTDDVMNDIQKKIELSQRDKPAIVFDLGNVDYICSSFLRLTLWVAKQANKNHEEFEIKNTKYDVKKIFQYVGFDKIMTIK
ncbi:MAG: STAS domain-containing protein [Parachlamydiales bacterium]|nr:STAS domain-containing protein [Parachlamydiales bacterium]